LINTSKFRAVFLIDQDPAYSEAAQLGEGESDVGGYYVTVNCGTTEMNRG